MYIHPLNNEVQQNNSSLQSSKSDETGKESIFMSFNDEDGIIQKTDIQFANKKSEEIATPYLTFLDKYCDGKHNWTTALRETLNILINLFNENYKNYNENCNTKKSPTTIYNEDGSRKFRVSITLDKFLSSIEYTKKDGTKDKITFNYSHNKGLSKGNLIGYQYGHGGDSANFRNNGTIIQRVTDNGIATSKYNQREKLISKTTMLNQGYEPNSKILMDGILIEEMFGETTHCKETYIIKHYGLKEETTVKELKSRVLYDLEDNELIRTDYENNKVVNFVDNRSSDKKPIFDKTKLNGKFDNPVKQEFSGICYMVGITNSMILSDNKDNLKDLDNCVSYDEEKGIGTVTFKGLNRTYTFSLSEIEKHMARLGSEDPDFPLMALGYEQFLLEGEAASVDKEFLDDNITRAENQAQVDILHSMAITPPKAKTIDADLPNDFYFAITGKEMKKEVLNDNSFEEAKKSLNNGGIVNAGTIKENDEDDEFMNNHNYSVIKIDDENVTLLEPNSLKEITCSIAKFKQRFIAVFYN